MSFINIYLNMHVLYNIIRNEHICTADSQVKMSDTAENVTSAIVKHRVKLGRNADVLNAIHLCKKCLKMRVYRNSYL